MRLVFDSLAETQGLTKKADHLLTLVHKGRVISPGSVPLQEGKLTQVVAASLTLPKTVADLEYPGIAGGDQSLHREFRRSVEESVADSDCVDVEFRGQFADEVGCLHLQVALRYKEMPDRLYDLGPQDEFRLFGGQNGLMPGGCFIL